MESSFPTIEEAKPHCGLSAKRSSGINRFASLMRRMRSWGASVCGRLVLINPRTTILSSGTCRQLKGVNAAAGAMGLQIEVFSANTSAEIDAAFETMGRERPDAVLVGTTAFLNGRRVQLAHLATFHRLPAIYALRDYAEAGV
jgi:hypothetical protein